MKHLLYWTVWSAFVLSVVAARVWPHNLPLEVVELATALALGTLALRYRPS
jgi:hypothetical protein